ncbi:MAG: argininosuccinate lyase, partial [Pseudonocardiales bacterium]|nr:argininosuccinate lyase [Pseudonocardiales bacterium]
PDVRDVLSVHGALQARSAVGGTAPARVAEQLEALTADVHAQAEWAGGSGPG